jgi:hypothetical protein
MAEELGFGELAREARAAQIDERLARATPLFVEPAREHSFAGARFTPDQNGSLGVEHRFGLGLQLAYRATLTQKRNQARPSARDGQGAFSPATLRLQRTPHQNTERLEIDGFGQEVLCARLDRLHRQLDRADTSEQNVRVAAIPLAGCLEYVEGGAVRQLVVDNGQIGILRGLQLATFGACACFQNGEPRAPEVVRKHAAHLHVVLDEQDRSRHSSTMVADRRLSHRVSRLGLGVRPVSTASTNLGMLNTDFVGAL